MTLNLSFHRISNYMIELFFLLSQLFLSYKFDEKDILIYVFAKNVGFLSLKKDIIF